MTKERKAYVILNEVKDLKMQDSSLTLRMTKERKAYVILNEVKDLKQKDSSLTLRMTEEKEKAYVILNEVKDLKTERFFAYAQNDRGKGKGLCHPERSEGS